MLKIVPKESKKLIVVVVNYVGYKAEALFIVLFCFVLFYRFVLFFVGFLSFFFFFGKQTPDFAGIISIILQRTFLKSLNFYLFAPESIWSIREFF